MGLFSVCILLSQKTKTSGLLLISCYGIDKDKNPKYTNEFNEVNSVVEKLPTS